MKTFVLLLTAAFCCSFYQESPRLKGIYRIEFDKKYALHGYQVTFADSVYTKKMPDAVTSKGKISYDKFKTTFRKNADEDPIEIDNRDISKDTIKFSTKNKRDLSLTVNRGKMIKVK